MLNRGDINPATKKGFKLIETLEAGMSPLSYQRDLEYEKLMNKSNEIQG